VIWVIINNTVWAAVREGERGEFVDVGTVSGCLEYSQQLCRNVDRLAPTWAKAAPVKRFALFQLVEVKEESLE
jgi:hypothetical protein